MGTEDGLRKETQLELLGRSGNGRGNLGKKWTGSLQIAVKQVVMNGAAIVFPKESS